MTLLDSALTYHDRGWSVIPVDDKRPAVRWKRYQDHRAKPDTIRRWFDDDNVGIATICGSISGHLGIRDYDEPGAYEAWRDEHPDLSSSLPTVRTPSGGAHVYFTAQPDAVSVIRESLERSDGRGAIHLADGELRVGNGCFSVAPPTRGYSWLIEPSASGLPVIDPVAAGFIMRLSPRVLRGTSAPFVAAEVNDLDHAVTLAVLRTIPTEYRQRHRLLFEFCRELKGLAPLADADADSLKPYFKQWFKLAQPHIRTKSFAASWHDFREGWGKVRYPKGTEPLARIYSEAVQTDPPKCAAEYIEMGDHKTVWLIQLARALQENNGPRPFYLDCRSAGKLLKVTHTTANKILSCLVKDGVLQLVKKGARGSGASEYRYLAD